MFDQNTGLRKFNHGLVLGLTSNWYPVGGIKLHVT